MSIVREIRQPPIVAHKLPAHESLVVSRRRIQLHHLAERIGAFARQHAYALDIRRQAHAIGIARETRLVHRIARNGNRAFGKLAYLIAERVFPMVERETGFGCCGKHGALAFRVGAETAHEARLGGLGGNAQRALAHRECRLKRHIAAHDEPIRRIGAAKLPAAVPAEEFRSRLRRRAEHDDLAGRIGPRPRHASRDVVDRNAYGALLGREYRPKLRVARRNETVFGLVAYRVALLIGPIFKCIALKCMRRKRGSAACGNRRCAFNPTGCVAVGKRARRIGHGR